jgi:hypothetical protein
MTMPEPTEPPQGLYDPQRAEAHRTLPWGVQSPFLKTGAFTWNGQEAVQLVPELGIAWIMPGPGFGASYRVLETQGQGSADLSADAPYRRLDGYVRYAQALNLHVIFVASANQYSAKGGGAADPMDPATVMAAIVERYDGDGQADMDGLRYPVRWWMVLNEAFMDRYWNIEPEEYVDFFIKSHDAIKGADPQAKVVLTSLFTPDRADSQDYAQRFFQAYGDALRQGRAPTTIDAWDLHWISPKEADAGLDVFRQGVQWQEEAMANLGLRVDEKICTEATVLSPDREVVERDVVKRYLLARSMGFTKILWSSLVSGDPGRDAFTSISLKVQENDPALQVYAFMSRSVGASSCTLVRHDNGMHEVRLSNGGAVVWMAGSGTATVSTGGRRAFDIYGVQIAGDSVVVDQAPVYLLHR